MPRFPKTFTITPRMLKGYYNSVSMSTNGKYQTIVQRGQTDAACAQGNLYVSWNFGKNFVTRLENLNLTGVAVSATGKYQTAVVQGNSAASPPQTGYIYTSSDNGHTWTQNKSAPSNGWYGVAMSANGKYQLALPNSYKSAPDNGFLYISSDYGETWTPQTGPGEQLWLNGAISASGEVMAAVVFGTLPDTTPTSTEKEEAFTTTAVISRFLSRSAYTATSTDEALPGAVYLSKDYGHTWFPVPNLTDFFTCVAMSSDGTYLTVGAQNCFYAPAIPKPLYTSSDGGVNWFIRNTDTDNWLGVAMSGDGLYQCALSYQQEPDSVSSGYVYRSIDYGATWVRNKSLPQNEWTSTAISRDGNTQTVVATNCGNVFQAKCGS